MTSPVTDPQPEAGCQTSSRRRDDHGRLSGAARKELLAAKTWDDTENMSGGAWLVFACLLPSSTLAGAWRLGLGLALAWGRAN